MLLKDATSKEEVAAALEAGDDELQDDIDEQLKEAALLWESGGDYCEYDEFSLKDFFRFPSDEFIEFLITESPGEYSLTGVTADEIKAQLAHDAGNRRPNTAWQVGVFKLEDRPLRRNGIAFEVERNLHCWFPAHLYPENAEFIPADIATTFWTDRLSSVEWEVTDRFAEGNTGWHTGADTSYINCETSDFEEWCRDLVGSEIGNIIKNDPAKARSMFWSSLQQTSEDVARRFREAKPTDDDVLALTAQWFEPDAERADVVDQIEDFIGSMVPSGEALGAGPDVIAEVTEDDLRQLGITSGTLWEERPWKLVRLRPHELPLEGALMNHCVGERRMGYIKAVRDGETEIWSLRSRANKPRFTLEVDGAFNDPSIDEESAGLQHLTAPRQRAGYIKQLKGKGNRTPGYADKHASEIKFPHEVTLWRWLFSSKLGVDPFSVYDLYRAQQADEQPQPNRRSSRRTSRRRTSRRIASSPRRNTGEACVGFDQPYRPLVEPASKR